MKKVILPYSFFIVFLCLSVALWIKTKNIQAIWLNVPPAFSQTQGKISALGDSQFLYRSIGFMLQNLGDYGGQSHTLREYNYENLKDWFFLAHSLDKQSDFIPLLAAYYYGANTQGEDLKYIIDFLEIVGQEPYPQKWRWLAHAVFLARYQQEDINKAFYLAEMLARIDEPGVAIWAKQMPAFISLEMGDKEAAYHVMRNILIENVEDIHPNEVNFMIEYICKNLKSIDEKQAQHICQ